MNNNIIDFSPFNPFENGKIKGVSDKGISKKALDKAFINSKDDPLFAGVTAQDTKDLANFIDGSASGLGYLEECEELAGEKNMAWKTPFNNDILMNITIPDSNNNLNPISMSNFQINTSTAQSSLETNVKGVQQEPMTTMVNQKLSSNDPYDWLGVDCITNSIRQSETIEENIARNGDSIGKDNIRIIASSFGNHENMAKAMVGCALGKIKHQLILPSVGISKFSGENQMYNNQLGRQLDAEAVNISISEKFGKYPIKGSFNVFTGVSGASGHWVPVSYEINEKGQLFVASLNSVGGTNGAVAVSEFIEIMEHKLGFRYIGPRDENGRGLPMIPDIRPEKNKGLFTLQGESKEFYMKQGYSEEEAIKLSASFHGASCYKNTIRNSIAFDQISLEEVAKAQPFYKQDYEYDDNARMLNVINGVSNTQHCKKEADKLSKVLQLQISDQGMSKIFPDTNRSFNRDFIGNSPNDLRNNIGKTVSDFTNKFGSIPDYSNGNDILNRKFMLERQMGVPVIPDQRPIVDSNKNFIREAGENEFNKIGYNIIGGGKTQKQLSNNLTQMNKSFSNIDKKPEIIFDKADSEFITYSNLIGDKIQECVFSEQVGKNAMKELENCIYDYYNFTERNKQIDSKGRPIQILQDANENYTSFKEFIGNLIETVDELGEVHKQKLNKALLRVKTKLTTEVANLGKGEVAKIDNMFKSFRIKQEQSNNISLGK